MNKIPVVSIFKIYANARRILKNPLPFHRENFDKFGDTFAVQLGLKKKSIFTRDQGLTVHILQKQQRKYYKSRLQTDDLAKYIGNGLLTSNGSYWLQQRRLIQPAFHKKKLLKLIDVIKNTIHREVNSFPVNKTLDIYPMMSSLAFQVVAKSLFNADMQQEMTRLQFVTEAAQTMLIRELRQPYFKWWFRLSGQIKKNIALTEEAKEILESIVESRKASGKSYDDLLDMLLAARYDDGSAMENKQLIDEIMVFFTAGHETTANALTFTLALLAMHPEVQQKVYEEVITVDRKEFDNLEELSGLVYTRQCIEEAMRLYPPAYITDRVNIEEDEFEDIRFKKGTLILVSFYEIHRHKEVWEEPEKFKPDRFHPDRKKMYSNWYFPFGAGPRMCIGNNFAMYEMILAIARIVKQFKVETDQKEIKIKPLITMRPDDIQLKFLKREFN